MRRSLQGIPPRRLRRRRAPLVRLEVAQPGPAPEIVALAEEVLEAAKTGRVRSLSVAMVEADGTAKATWRLADGAWHSDAVFAVAHLQKAMLEGE